MTRKLLSSLSVGYFLFLPLFFLVHLIFNSIGITQFWLLFAITIGLSFWGVSQRHLVVPLEGIEGKASLGIGFITVFLLLANFLVGVDHASDSYLYHLNTAFPISLYHDVFSHQWFDLNHYSVGYPKFAEFIQANFLQLTHHPYGYGMASVLVIPASYIVSFIFARHFNVSISNAKIIAFTYAINPINIAQATTGYIDTLHALYVLVCIVLALKARTKGLWILFLLNLAVLTNIKFTGVLLFPVILVFACIWQRHIIFNKKHRLFYLLVTPVVLSLGGIHYLHNLSAFATPVYPFIDSALATKIAYLYTPATGKLSGILDLFWQIPTPFSQFVLYDALQGAFSILWYPMPVFILIVMGISIYQKQYQLSSIYLLFILLLLIDPVPSIGRYVSYFQLLGFFSFIYLVAEFKLIQKIVWLLPAAYVCVAAFILVGTEVSLLPQRQHHAQHIAPLLNQINSIKQQAIPIYYNIQSGCSGYYWLARFNGLAVQQVTHVPVEDKNYLFITETAAKKCIIQHSNNVMVEATLQQTTVDSPLLYVNITPPAVIKDCKICISEYGCMYLPAHMYRMELNLKHLFNFSSTEEKSLNLVCKTQENQIIEKKLIFH